MNNLEPSSAGEFYQIFNQLCTMSCKKMLAVGTPHGARNYQNVSQDKHSKNKNKTPRKLYSNKHGSNNSK